MLDLLKSLFQITTTKAVISLFGLLVGTGTYLVSDNNESGVEEFVESESTENSFSQNKADKHVRSPASSVPNRKNNNSRIQYSSAPQINNKNENNYNSVNNQTDYFNDEKNESFSNTSSLNSPMLSSMAPPASLVIGDDNVQPAPKKSSPDLRSSSSSSSTSSSSSVASGILPGTTRPTDTVKKSTETSTTPKVISSSTSGSSSIPLTNNCSTDILSGTFGNPIGVTISCSYLSNIKYCLAKDACCDPYDSGSDYTTTITVGAENGNFCLSFYGDSENGGATEVVQSNYTINNTYPNLNVGTPKTFYQSTELSGESFITSTDFGKANHYTGQINFKSHDPTATGLDYSCQEIAENDHLSIIPTLSTTLALFNVSGLLPSNEIKIPLRENKLDYGLNFLSSFIKNNSFVTPLYSCSTTQITLEDFNYFESTMAQASSGDNDVREFEGQFSNFGFFEADTQVFRGPAGESTNEKNGTYLESGLLSVFY